MGNSILHNMELMVVVHVCKQMSLVQFPRHNLPELWLQVEIHEIDDIPPLVLLSLQNKQFNVIQQLCFTEWWKVSLRVECRSTKATSIMSWKELRCLLTRCFPFKNFELLLFILLPSLSQKLSSDPQRMLVL